MDCCLRTEGIRRLLSILMQARLSLLIGDPPLDIVFYFEGISFHGKKKSRDEKAQERKTNQ